MSITLAQVKQTIEEGHTKAHEDSESLRDEVKIVGDHLKKYFAGLAARRLDDLEASREKKAQGSGIIQSIKDKTPKPIDFTKFLGMPALAALAGALSGLRGWELRAARNLRNILRGIRNFGRRVGDLVRRLGRGIRNIGRSLGRGLRNLTNNRFVRAITDPIRNAFRNVGRSLRQGFRNIARSITDPIRNAFRNIGRSLRQGFRNIARSITDPIRNAFRNIGRNLDRGLRNIARSITAPIRNAFRNVGRSLGRGLRNIGDARFIRDIAEPMGRMSRRLRNALMNIGNSKILKSITDPIRNGVRSLRNTARAFALSTALRGPIAPTASRLPTLTGIKNLIPGNIGKGFEKIASALKPILTVIGDLASGAGKAVASLGGGAVKLIGSGLGPIVKTFSKILWPLGVLMSLFEGVKAYQAEKGDKADKFAAGIAGFLGDFIGAPLNLIKGALSWVLKEMGFEKAGEWLDKNINYSAMISNTLNTLWDWFRGGLRWFGTLLTDPVEALKQLWNGLLEGSANLGEWLWNKGIKPIGEWVLSFIPNPVPWLKEQWNSIWGGITDFGSWLWSNTFGALGEWVTSFLPNPIESLKSAWAGIWGDATGLGDYIWKNAIEPIGNWFKTLFTDPVEALKQYWSTLLGGVATVGDFIWSNFVQPLGEWVTSMFNITWPSISFSEIITDLKDSILNYASNIISYLKDSIKNWWNGSKDEFNPEDNTKFDKFVNEWGENTDFTGATPMSAQSEPTPASKPEPVPKLKINPKAIPTPPKVSAEDIAEVQAYLDSTKAAASAAPVVATSTANNNSDNSIKVQQNFSPAANNVDPAAYAIPGYYRN